MSVHPHRRITAAHSRTTADIPAVHQIRRAIIRMPMVSRTATTRTPTVSRTVTTRMPTVSRTATTRMPTVSRNGYNQNAYGQQNGYNQYGGYGNVNAMYNTGDGSPKYVGFGEAISLYFRNFINFNGRSTRSEYWFAMLFLFVVSLCANVIDSLLLGDAGILPALINIAFFLPSLGLNIRRLHDSGKSAWYLLLGIIPFAGWIIMLVFYCQPSVGQNKWGAAANPTNSSNM